MCSTIGMTLEQVKGQEEAYWRLSRKDPTTDKYVCIYPTCRQHIGGPNLFNLWQHIQKHVRTDNYNVIELAFQKLKKQKKRKKPLKKTSIDYNNDKIFNFNNEDNINNNDDDIDDNEGATSPETSLIQEGQDGDMTEEVVFWCGDTPHASEDSVEMVVLNDPIVRSMPSISAVKRKKPAILPKPSPRPYKKRKGQTKEVHNDLDDIIPDIPVPSCLPLPPLPELDNDSDIGNALSTLIKRDQLRDRQLYQIKLKLSAYKRSNTWLKKQMEELRKNEKKRLFRLKTLAKDLLN